MLGSPQQGTTGNVQVPDVPVSHFFCRLERIQMTSVNPVNRWTEPGILLLIILNAVVLFIQASVSHALPSTWPDDTPPPSVSGYFHHWEDYVLFVLFCLFT